MKNRVQIFLTFLLLVCFSCSKDNSNDFVHVEGGNLNSLDSLTNSKKIVVADFYISKSEVTQKEWTAIMGDNRSELTGENLPATNMTWYDCIEYCNKKSVLEEIQPYYDINKTEIDQTNTDSTDTAKWTIKINKKSKGYRLPTVYEWEYAASGGKKTKKYTYSGSNSLNDVAWYYVNSGKKILSGMWSYKSVVENECKPHPVNSKVANELGLFDMSGNVREWCYGFQNNGIGDTGRPWKGGGWAGGDYVCEPVFTRYQSGIISSNDLGFRIVKNE